MSQTICLNARWVIPVDDARVLERHSVVIEQDRIAAVLPQAEAARRYGGDAIVDLNEHALLPGFVNAHTHAAMSLFRGLADDLPLMDWLQKHIWPAEGRWVSPPFMHDGVRLSVAEMIKGGVTCINDMYFFPDATARAVRELGIRACVGLVVIDFPTAWAQHADEYIDKALKLHDELRDTPLLTTAFAPHAPYTVGDAALERIRTFADEIDIPIHMHVHETAHEVQEAQRQQGLRPLARLDRLGLLTPRMMAVHMTQLTDEEIALVAARGVHVLHCPESNLKIASGFCPVHKLAQAGVNIAVGTDGAASNNDQDMLGELRTAALLAKGVSGDPTAVPALAALRMATLNGAKAIGLDDRIGSITPGKAADLVAIDLSSLATEPVYDPISQVVYATGRDQVTDVWIAGRRVLESRRLTTVDEAALRQAARAWRDKIASADRGN